MAKNTRAPRRRKPTLNQATIALLTGGPLPSDGVSGWMASYLTNIDQPGPLDTPDYRTPFIHVWAQYHGKPMSPADRAAVEARFPEIRAAVRRRQPAPVPVTLKDESR